MIWRWCYPLEIRLWLVAGLDLALSKHASLPRCASQWWTSYLWACEAGSYCMPVTTKDFTHAQHDASVLCPVAAPSTILSMQICTLSVHEKKSVRVSRLWWDSICTTIEILGSHAAGFAPVVLPIIILYKSLPVHCHPFTGSAWAFVTAQ
jgi:hypothetical protein